MDEPQNDDDFMKEALAEAELARDAGDVPVGAVVVHKGKVVARGRNRRQVRIDPTAHAEIEVLRQAANYFGSWHIEGTLYVTQEPCPMCAGAVVNARLQRLVYGCANPKAGAVDSLYSILSDTRLNHQVDVTSGVLADKCAAALREFFASLRQTTQVIKPLG